MALEIGDPEVVVRDGLYQSVFVAFLRISIALALLVFYLYPAFVALVSVVGASAVVSAIVGDSDSPQRALATIDVTQDPAWVARQATEARFTALRTSD